MKPRLTGFVLFAMIAGPLLGFLLQHTLGAGSAADNVGAGLSMVTTSFLRLIKMIIAPLVFCTLTVGVARMEGGAAIARVGAKTLAWFVSVRGRPYCWCMRSSSAASTWHYCCCGFSSLSACIPRSAFALES